MWPIKITGNDGVVVIDGEAEGTPPSGMESLAGNNVNIGNGNGAPLTFDTKNFGSDLLDITTPAVPRFVSAGIYSITAVVIPDPLTAAGSYEVALAASGNSYALQDSAPSTANQAAPLTTTGATVKVAAGDTLGVSVTNNDGVGAVNFKLGIVTVTKLS